MFTLLRGVYCAPVIAGGAAAAAGGAGAGASWLAPAIVGGAGLLGSAIGAASQQNMNLTNRTWSAQQAQLNRDFQAQQILQQEAYQTQMSDTAVQRRVADLKAAGLNPALSVMGMGSAQAMAGGAAPGSMASAPSTQAPGAAFGSLGANTASAVGLAQQQAQIANLNAQTRLTTSQTPVARYIDTETNPDGSTTLTVNGNAGHELGEQQLDNQRAVINQINADIRNKDSQVTLNQALTVAKGLDIDLARDTLASLIKANNANNLLEETTATSGQKVMGANVAGTNAGTWIEALRLIIGSTKGR